MRDLDILRQQHNALVLKSLGYGVRGIPRNTVGQQRTFGRETDVHSQPIDYSTYTSLQNGDGSINMVVGFHVLGYGNVKIG